MGEIIVHTLAFNLPSEVKIATKSLYEKNKDCDFKHYIVDLGFPLERGADVPENIAEAKRNNSRALIAIAQKYGSHYLEIPNQGVSQNWTAVMKAVNLKDDDSLLCADPDERPLQNGWVRAVDTVLQAKEHTMAWCSLSMPDVPMNPAIYDMIDINGYATHVMRGQFNWPQGGFKGKFLNQIGGIPVPKGAPIYGWIEHACFPFMEQYGYAWGILRDYHVNHTECSPLYREWKTFVTSNIHLGQKSFENWLREAKKAK